MQSLGKLLAALLLCLTALPLSSCSSNLAATTAECALPLPVTVSQDDHFTDTTARQILAADRAYEKLCVKGSR